MKRAVIVLILIGLFIFGMLKYFEGKDEAKKEQEVNQIVYSRTYDSLSIDSFYVLCEEKRINFISSINAIQRLTGGEFNPMSAEDSMIGFSKLDIQYKEWQLFFIRMDTLLALQSVKGGEFKIICAEAGELFGENNSLGEFKELFPYSAIHQQPYANAGRLTEMLVMPILNKNPNGVYSHMELYFDVAEKLKEVQYVTKVELNSATESITY